MGGGGCPSPPARGGGGGPLPVHRGSSPGQPQTTVTSGGSGGRPSSTSSAVRTTTTEAEAVAEEHLGHGSPQDRRGGPWSDLDGLQVHGLTKTGRHSIALLGRVGCEGLRGRSRASKGSSRGQVSHGSRFPRRPSAWRGDPRNPGASGRSGEKTPCLAATRSGSTASWGRPKAAGGCSSVVVAHSHGARSVGGGPAPGPAD